MENIVEVNGLERVFGQNRAVDGMTFHVKQGEVFGLLGPNGAGLRAGSLNRWTAHPCANWSDDGNSRPI